MSSQATQLLQLLASTANPQVRTGGSPSGLSVGGLDFASLLQNAQSGRIASGREVTVSKNAGLSLTSDQLQRLSAVADRAEAMGASQALVMIDGQSLSLDVSSRQITGAIDAQSGTLLNGIDAVLTAPPSAAQAAPAAGPAPPGINPALGILPLPNPGAGSANASLLQVLAAAAGR